MGHSCITGKNDYGTTFVNQAFDSCLDQHSNLLSRAVSIWTIGPIPKIDHIQVRVVLPEGFHDRESSDSRIKESESTNVGHLGFRLW